MRNNDEFRSEIFRRKNRYIKKRNARIGVVSTLLSVAVFSLVFWTSPPRNDLPISDGNNSHLSDVMVTIHLFDQILTDADDVAPRLEILSQYVPLPEGNCVKDETDDVGGDFASDNEQTQPSATDTDCIPSSKPQLTFTVVSGDESITYTLRDNSITADGKTYPLTEEEFNELFALFGGDENE